MTLTAARRVADAVLYEGYLLYPYRASSAKNQVRWQFGVLGPAGAAAAGVGEERALAAEVVLTAAPEARLDLHLRFLQVQARVVERRTPDGPRVTDGWVPVDELPVGGTRWVPFHEATPREIELPGLAVEDLRAGRVFDVAVPGGEEIEELFEDGLLVGRLVRTRWALRAVVTVTARPGSDPRAVVLRVRVENQAVWSGAADPAWAPRDLAARSSFVGTHLLLRAHGTRFVSLLDPPAWAAVDAASCAQSRCWPGLVADDHGGDAVLISPIVLGDHPAIAPESAGDLFDATEIDEILTLRIMTMTGAEQAEARGTDPRAAAILARCDAMTRADLERLHGARRPGSPGTGGPPTDDVPTDSDLPADDAVPADGDLPADGDEVPWWDAGRDARAEPTTDVVLVAGVAVARGTRVRLRPSRRADAQDLFLAGRAARVARVYFDVDGGTHVAVVLEDDPAADLYGATGRFYYFGPEELEPLPPESDRPEPARPPIPPDRIGGT
ncbi:MAG: hypothetical protein ACQSGP_14250 [Frankia sp.]